MTWCFKTTQRVSLLPPGGGENEDKIADMEGRREEKARGRRLEDRGKSVCTKAAGGQKESNEMVI